MSKTIDLEQIPVIKELVEAAIDEKTTPLEDEIEDIKKNGDRVHQFLLYDWDDTLIGVVAVPMGYDPRPYINKYVKENLIHPQLRNQTAEQFASRERTDNYRGEYPHTGPDENDPLRTGGADTAEDGGDYPLTNHLEYCFMGKDLDEDYPYVSGWTEVTPENMADTFTALTTQSDGTVAATEFGPAPTEEGATAPRIAQFDWTDIASITTPAIKRLKACYKRGSMCNYGSSSYKSEISDLEVYTIYANLFKINAEYKRINRYGNGVSADPCAGIRTEMRIPQNEEGECTIYNLAQIVKPAGDTVSAEILIPDEMYDIKISLRGALNTYNIITSTSRSDRTTITDTKPALVNYYKHQWYNAETYQGVEYRREDYYNLFKFAYAVSTREVVTYITEESANSRFNNSNKYILYFYAAAKEAGQTDYNTYTWFQWQYAILTCTTAAKTVYKTPAEAEAYMRETYPDIVAHYEGTEETTE